VTDGKVLMECIIETKAATVLEFFQGLRGSLWVTFEEGTRAAWLYDPLKPRVTKVVVCDPRQVSCGSRSPGIVADRVQSRPTGMLASVWRVDGTPAARRPAFARNPFGIVGEVVIDGQLFALADSPPAHTQDAAIPEDRPDVRIASVIDVLGAAAADRAVECPVFVESEKVDHASLLFAAAHESSRFACCHMWMPTCAAGKCALSPH
jgi:hypothetical protein